MPNLIDYGFRPSMMPENADGIPARVTACLLYTSRTGNGNSPLCPEFQLNVN